MGLRLAAMSPLELIQSGVDVLIVAYLFYRILVLIRNTRAFQLVKGIVVLFMATEASDLLGLSTLHTVLQAAQVGLLVAIPVVFQPELRGALERLGRTRILGTILPESEVGDGNRQMTVEAVVRAAMRFSRERTGALMVVERQTGLADIASSGIPLEARVSWQILVNIFTPNTPLHDGAVIIRQGRVLAAGCFLPLAATSVIAHDLGTRHRAAVGVSEVSDALAVVISEETGVVSLAIDGHLIRHLDEGRLRTILLSGHPSESAHQEAERHG